MLANDALLHTHRTSPEEALSSANKSATRDWRTSRLQAGMQANGAYSGVHFVRTDVLHARRGLVVQSVAGAHTMHDVSFHDIAVERLSQSTPTAGPITPVSISAGSASIENVTVTNCSLPEAPAGSRDGVRGQIQGGTKGSASSVSAVAFKDLLFDGECATGTRGFDVSGRVSGLTFNCT